MMKNPTFLSCALMFSVLGCGDGGSQQEMSFSPESLSFTGKYGETIAPQTVMISRSRQAPPFYSIENHDYHLVDLFTMEEVLARTQVEASPSAYPMTVTPKAGLMPGSYAGTVEFRTSECPAKAAFCPNPVPGIKTSFKYTITVK